MGQWRPTRSVSVLLHCAPAPLPANRPLCTFAGSAPRPPPSAISAVACPRPGACARPGTSGPSRRLSERSRTLCGRLRRTQFQRSGGRAVRGAPIDRNSIHTSEVVRAPGHHSRFRAEPRLSQRGSQLWRAQVALLMDRLHRPFQAVQTDNDADCDLARTLSNRNDIDSLPGKWL